MFETEPVHQHLPMVERMGFISWDRDANESSKGPDWDAVAPLLGLIHGHREELPEG